MPNEILAKRLQNSTRNVTNERMSSRINNSTYFSIRESLRLNILHLYGEEIFQATKTYEKLRAKRCTLLCDLSFLITCRNLELQPTFTKLSYHTKTRRIQAILNKASTALLKEQIKRTRHQISETEQKLYKLHLNLSNKICHILWQRIELLTHWRTETDRNITSEKHNNKLQKLKENSIQHQKPTSPTNHHTVVNISTHKLQAAETSVLSKGFNYAIAPKRIPIEEIIANVETSLTSLDEQSAEQIRQDVTRILKSSKPPKPNLTPEESQALKKLTNMEEITIVPADKGNATVVMDTEEYKNKIKAILEDPSYKLVSRDPTTYLEKTTKCKIKESPIDEEIKKKIIPREKSSRCPKFYGLPKIHKEDAPLRPIVSAFNSPLQKLEKYLASILQPISTKAESYVRNSEHFTQILDSLTISSNDIIASFDVKSLYPSIPIDEALQQIEQNEDIPGHIIDLSRHCLNNAYFMYDKQIYRQIEGAAMGSSLSPVVANLFMIYFEKKAMETAIQKPKLWIRYVDDVFVIWPFGKDRLSNFLDHLNSIHGRIQFTLEIEENNQLPFLDVLITKTQAGRLQHTVYRKPTHTNRYLNAESHHHPSQLQAVANTLVSRSIRLTDDANKTEELNKISTALSQNGYKRHTINKAINKQQDPPSRPAESSNQRTKTILPYIKGTTDRIGRLLRKQNISTAYKPLRTIRSFIRNPKDKIPLENQGVYSVPCLNCHKEYVGQTNRRTSARLEEHRLAIKNKQTTSALFQHQHQTGHKIDFSNCKLIANVENYKTRTIREAIEIEKTGQLNKRDDALNLPSTWKTLLKKQACDPTDSKSINTTVHVPQKEAEPTPTTPHQHYNLRSKSRINTAHASQTPSVQSQPATRKH